MTMQKKERLLKMLEGAEIRLEAYKSNHDRDGIDLETRMIRMLKAELRELGF